MSDESTNQSGGIRSKVLIGILVIALVALAYDYQVARPAVETAYDAIAERSIEVNAKSTEVFTNLDVRKLLDMEPSKTFNDSNGDVVEVFSWRSGLPIKTHDLFAVYKPNGGKNLFYRHAKYKYEASGEVSDFSVATVVESNGDEPEDTSAEEMEGRYATGGPGGGGPGGGGPGGGGPGGGGGGFNPEAMFAENDADGDGFLKDDEISDRMRENLAEIDTDGDGAVSKDELMTRFAQRGGGGRPGGGGGRPGGGGGPGGGGSRPPLESDGETSSETGAAPAAQAEENVQSGSEAEAEADAETKPEIEAEAEAEADAETKPEIEAEPKAEADSKGDEA